MADCSQLLPNDVWCFIGEKLCVTADRIGFRSVCRRWRSVLPFPQPPWLVLAEDEQTPNTRGFFGLGQSDEGKEVYQFELPEVYHTLCLGSTGTWLVTIDLQRKIRIINPFSRLQFHLPSQDTLEYGPEKEDYQLDPKILRDGFTWKVILSSPPSSSSPQDCIALALHQCNRRLAIARPGDPSWTTVQAPIFQFLDAIFYKNQFYAINYNGILVVLGDHQTSPKATALNHRFKPYNCHHNLYLVEWNGELLLVIRIMHDEDELETYYLDGFQVYVFDFVNMKWGEFNNLGEHSLFLGFNTSVAVLASRYPGLKKNCVYYTDDYMFGYRGMEVPGGHNMGIFNLEDKTITPHYKGVSTSLYSPPLWIIPECTHPGVDIVAELNSTELV